MKAERIEIRAIYGRVVDPSPDLDRELSERLAVAVPGAYYSPKVRAKVWDGKIRFYRRPGAKFLRGLLARVLKVFDEVGAPRPSIVDLRERPQEEPLLEKLCGVSFEGKRAYQLQLAKKMFRQGQGVLRAATASGKTEIAAYVIAQLGLPTVFLTHTKELFFQTAGRLEDRLGIKIGRIGAGEWDEQLITVALVQTLFARLEDGDLPVLLNCGCIVADEVHHGSSQSWARILERCPAYYRFGISAEPLVQSDPRNWRLIGLTGEVIEGISLEKLVSKGLAAKPEIHVLTVPGSLVARGYALVRQRGIDEHEYRNKQIVQILMNHPKESILVLVQTIRHGRELERLCSRAGVRVVFACGLDPTEERKVLLQEFRDKEVSKVVATPIYDEGIDVPAVDVLVLAGGGKSPIRLLQRVGRAVRKRPGKSMVKVYDFADGHHKYLRRHFSARRRIYEREKFEIIFEH